MYASFLSCDLGILLQGKRQHIKWKWKRHGLLIKYIGFHLLLASYLFQWSPTFLAPGTSSMEDSFSTDWGRVDGFRMIQAHYIQVYLLLCGPVPNRPGLVPVHGPEVRDS